MAASSKSMAQSKRKLADMSMDEFLEHGFEGDTSASESSVVNGKPDKKKARKRKKKEKKAELVKTDDAQNGAKKKNKKQKMLNGKPPAVSPPPPVSVPEEEDEESEEDFVVDESNTDVLEFEMSSASDSEYDDSEDAIERRKTHHTLPKELVVASDDEDDEDDDDGVDPEKRVTKTKATTKFIEDLNKQLQTAPTVPLVREAMQLFRAAVAFVGRSGAEQPRPDKSKKGQKPKTKKNEESAPVIGGPSRFLVEGGTVFNKAVQLCLGGLAPALQTILGQPPADQPFSSKGKSWRRIKVDVKAYLSDLMQLLSVMSDAEMALLLLNHMSKLLHLYAAFPKLHKTLVKRMIRTWSQGEEATRLKAFVILHRLLRLNRDWLSWVLRQMYVSYVRNCRFTTPDLLPLIAFMRRTLVETLLLDATVAYELAFVFIRQLVIHLRNAVRVKKKENCQVVYNWQSVRCLELWVELLTAPNTSPLLEPLQYPLSQTLLGTISLLPTAKYIPLRLHLVHAMNKLSADTSSYIPILPCILEVFELVDFNKRHKSISAKPFNFACMLKFSKAQMQEKVFRDGLVDQVYEVLMEQFHIHAHKLAFPELTMPALVQLKSFLKRCKVNNFCKQIKQVVDKVTENAKFIAQRRKSVTFGLKDAKECIAWEELTRVEGTPLTRFYTTWRQLRDKELEVAAAGKDAVVGIPGVDEIETLKPSNKLKLKPTEEDRRELKELFVTDSSDSEDEDEQDEDRFLAKAGKGNKAAEQDSDSGDYSDFDSDELEQLAQSADEDDDEEEDGADSNEDGEDEEDEELEDEEEESEEESDEEEVAPPRKKMRIAGARAAADSDDSDSDLDLQDMVEDFRLSDSE